MKLRAVNISCSAYKEECYYFVNKSVFMETAPYQEFRIRNKKNRLF